MTESIAVLLATHNGLRWLPEQLDSILGQAGVNVRVIVSDDASSDGTAEWLVERARVEPRVILLPSAGRLGSAAANFYRLIRDANTGTDLVAFADQDDVWATDKLATQAHELRERGVGGISSDVMAFDETGKRTLIRKSFPQREYDFLLESPGPGCTFLMTPQLVQSVRELLGDESSGATEVQFHDWLVYALARANGSGWFIQPRVTVDYRQHDSNAFGANAGAGQAVSRLKLIRRSWHRGEALKIARAVRPSVPSDRAADFDHVTELLATTGFRARLGLLRRAGQLRRRVRDQWIIGGLIAIGTW